jgi:hypothetical protein
LKGSYPHGGGAQASAEPARVFGAYQFYPDHGATVRGGASRKASRAALLPRRGSTRHNQGMGRKDKGREICITCGQTFHKKLTSKELRCTKCRKAEKKAA